MFSKIYAGIQLERNEKPTYEFSLWRSTIVAKRALLGVLLASLVAITTPSDLTAGVHQPAEYELVHRRDVEHTHVKNTRYHFFTEKIIEEAVSHFCTLPPVKKRLQEKLSSEDLREASAEARGRRSGEPRGARLPPAVRPARHTRSPGRGATDWATHNSSHPTCNNKVSVFKCEMSMDARGYYVACLTHTHTHTHADTGAWRTHLLNPSGVFPDARRFIALSCKWPQTVDLNPAHFEVKRCSKQNLTSDNMPLSAHHPRQRAYTLRFAWCKFINLYPRSFRAPSSNAYRKDRTSGCVCAPHHRHTPSSLNTHATAVRARRSCF